MSCFAVLFATLAVPLGHLYTQDRAVIAMVAALLPIAAVFQVFDGIQVVSAGVLRGAADITFPAVMALIGYWALALPVGWVLAFRSGLGARGLWWGFVVGLVAWRSCSCSASSPASAARSSGPGSRNERNAMSFKDHFSGHAAVYASFRPSYPAALFDFALSLVAGRALAWDCATGNGQAAWTSPPTSSG